MMLLRQTEFLNMTPTFRREKLILIKVLWNLKFLYECLECIRQLSFVNDLKSESVCDMFRVIGLAL